MCISDWIQTCALPIYRTRHRIARTQRRTRQHIEKSRRVAHAPGRHMKVNEREESAIVLAVDRDTRPARFVTDGAGAVRGAADRAAALAGTRYGHQACDEIGSAPRRARWCQYASTSG